MALTKKQRTDLAFSYFNKLSGHLTKIFDKDDADNFEIDPNELEDEERLHAFFHAIMNLVPARIYEQLTQDTEADLLTVNHHANRLIIEYTSISDEDEGEENNDNG